MGTTKKIPRSLILIWVFIVLGLGIVISPGMFRWKIDENDARAVALLRRISHMEYVVVESKAFDDNGDGVGDYGSLVQLGTLYPGELKQLLIKADPTVGKASGYVFELEIVLGSDTTPPSFNLAARPEIPGETGNKSYYLDETDVIRVEREGKTATVSSPPLDAGATGNIATGSTRYNPED